jgi:hypothetical protein|uniref:cDNA clone:J033136K12, full insert sequence n=1 Tax=Oryza sativa subsp. japonica TaxID=39947 RepID=B7F869_ORYSJ|nr:unnamed protein product [Oryza sativa Japonica Group]
MLYQNQCILPLDDIASTETAYSAHQVSMQSVRTKKFFAGSAERFGRPNFIKENALKILKSIWWANRITLLMQATCRWSMPSHGITLLMVDCGRVFPKAKRRSALVGRELSQTNWQHILLWER